MCIRDRFICVVLLVFDNQLIGLFGDSKQMLLEGSRYFAVMAFFYWLPGVTNAHQGFLRGVGKMKMTLYGTLTQITFRVIFTFLLVPRIGLVGVGFACIAGWIAMPVSYTHLIFCAECSRAANLLSLLH